MPTNPSQLAATRASTAQRRAAEPPSWVRSMVSRGGEPVEITGDEWRIERGAAWSLAELRVPEAASLSAGEFERAVAAAYQHLGALVSEHDLGVPVRFWNDVPCIGADAGGGSDRYMVFNAGRHRAFESWLDGGGRAFQPRFVAASAVDFRGRDLTLSVLTGPTRAVALENPRQRPAYRYSRRYGLVPPSFARAGIIDADERILLTAGTASVVGETSRHEHDLAGQLREIEINLAALVAVASDELPGDVAHLESDSSRCRGLLAAYRHLRVYVVRADDEPSVSRWLRRSFENARHIEVLPADLCRRDLLVEVEGVASLPPTGSSQPERA